MAVKSGSKVHTVRSTGKVAGPPEVVESAQLADNSSSGAVDYASPGETRVEHYGQEVVVSHPTPGPVTMTVGWLSDKSQGDGSDVETKVITPPTKRPAKTSGVEPETK